MTMQCVEPHWNNETYEENLAERMWYYLLSI